MQNKELLLAKIEEYKAKFVDLCWTDLLGKEQHITLSANFITDEIFSQGHVVFIEKIGEKGGRDKCALKLDLTTLVLEPFFHDATIKVRCDLVNFESQQAYCYDPRAVLTRAEEYLKETGIVDRVYLSLNLEFFLFDDVRWKSSVDEAFYKIDSESAFWNSAKVIAGGNIGHRLHANSGCFATPPLDVSQDVRSAISVTLENLGIKAVAHYHANASVNQCRLIIDFDTLKKTADAVQLIKYVVKQVAHNYGKTATFMPKPLILEYGSGMSCRQFLMQENKKAHADLALYYLGGILKHTKALNAFTNPTTLSYKRLLADQSTASLSCINSENHIEINFPDAAANSYLAFAALLMAGIDGIQNKINLCNKAENTSAKSISMSENLGVALESLAQDKDFLLCNKVFTPDLIATYSEIKNKEWQLINSLVHPMEFELYYSL